MQIKTGLTVLALALVAAPLSAQVKAKHDHANKSASSGAIVRNPDGTVVLNSDGTVAHRTTNIPPGQLPPKGMCRVWIEGVPPGQQPPVTDCASAERNRVANSTVIYGDRTSFPGKGKGKVKRDGRDDLDDNGIESADGVAKDQAKALRKANKEAAKAAKKREKGNRDGEDHDRDN